MLIVILSLDKINDASFVEIAKGELKAARLTTRRARAAWGREEIIAE